MNAIANVYRTREIPKLNSSKSNDSGEIWCLRVFTSCVCAAFYFIFVVRKPFLSQSRSQREFSSCFFRAPLLTHQFSWRLYAKSVIYILQSYLALNKFAFANKWNMNSEAKQRKWTLSSVKARDKVERHTHTRRKEDKIEVQKDAKTCENAPLQMKDIMFLRVLLNFAMWKLNESHVSTAIALNQRQTSQREWERNE